VLNKRPNLTSTALLVLCFSATLAQNNQLRFGSLAERYVFQSYGVNLKMSDTPPWEMLSEKAQNVYRQLGTRNQKLINKLKTQHLIDSVRESKMFGYDDNGPYKMLEHEVDRRDSNKKWILAVVATVIAVSGLLIKLFSD